MHSPGGVGLGGVGCAGPTWLASIRLDGQADGFLLAACRPPRVSKGSRGTRRAGEGGGLPGEQQGGSHITWCVREAEIPNKKSRSRSKIVTGVSLLSGKSQAF